MCVARCMYVIYMYVNVGGKQKKWKNLITPGSIHLSHVIFSMPSILSDILVM
jgi:hypothetical protein